MSECPPDSSPAEVLDNNRAGSHLNRTDWAAFVFAFAVVLAVFVYTLAPSVTLEMSGPFAVAADHLGVPHPPGFPIWTMLGWIFKSIFSFITYHGHPNPAWAIGLMSAFFGALTCGLVAALVSMLTRGFISSSQTTVGSRAPLGGWLIPWASGVSAGLILAFARSFWSQSVIVETHTLKVFFQTLILLLLVLWMDRRSPANSLLYASAFLLGAGISTHPTLILLCPLPVLCVLLKDRRLFRDFLVAGTIPLGIILLHILLNRLNPAAMWVSGGFGRVSWLNGPRSPAFWIWIAVNLSAIFLSWRLLSRGRIVAISLLLFQAGLLFCLYLPIAAETNPPVNWAYARTWEGFIHLLGRGQYEQLAPSNILSKTYLDQLVLYWKDLLLQFGYVSLGLGVAGFVVLLRKHWRVALVTLCTFLILSLLVVCMINPKGDLQDWYIQRVRFIQSQCVFVLWIGIGLAACLTLVNRLKSRVLLVLTALAILVLLPLDRVRENVGNGDAIRVFGRADQRGHDFGWQFGRYILDGSEAIREELAPGEVPPPDPSYPPPMEPKAVFFGGTDPGRFVPTYMIYSAEVRPDVFLITQNALADHTYMAVMRDLYGDEIWIPSAFDQSDAFKQYYDDVKAGRIPGHIDVRSGRIIVQGVGQVMAINGILCKMIHDHNKWRHTFYVEESYVIPWMYPYMEPHGLILKINSEPLARLSPDAIKKDMDFWAWYKRRLLNNKKFIANPVARRTFSKLRSAIAGLYEARGMLEQAEQAYLESVELCPASPEAHFRLTGLYMKTGRFEDAKRIMEQYQGQDPNNRNVPGTINNIDNKISMFARKDELEALLKAGPQPVDKVIELARVYRDLGNKDGFVQVADNILSNAQVPPDALLDVAQLFLEADMKDRMANTIETFFERAPSGIPSDRYQRIAQMYAQASMLPEASETLRRHLDLRPEDVNAQHELGVMYVHLERFDEAMDCFHEAVKLAGNHERDELAHDERLDHVRTSPQFRALLQEQSP